MTLPPLIQATLNSWTKPSNSDGGVPFAIPQDFMNFYENEIIVSLSFNESKDFISQGASHRELEYCSRNKY